MKATIGVNLLWLVPGVVGGSEEYTLRLLRGLDEVGADDLHLRIYGQRSLFRAHPDLADRFDTAAFPVGTGFRVENLDFHFLQKQEFPTE